MEANWQRQDVCATAPGVSVRRTQEAVRMRCLGLPVLRVFISHHSPVFTYLRPPMRVRVSHPAPPAQMRICCHS